MTTSAVKADAAERSVRTLLTGLALDVIVAIAAALLVWLPDADVSSREAWTVLLALLVKTILQAAASYVVRLKVAPSASTPR